MSNEPTITDKLNDPENWDIEGLIDDVKAELDSYGADDAIELINWLKAQHDDKPPTNNDPLRFLPSLEVCEQKLSEYRYVAESWQILVELRRELSKQDY